MTHWNKKFGPQIIRHSKLYNVYRKSKSAKRFRNSEFLIQVKETLACYILSLIDEYVHILICIESDSRILNLKMFKLKVWTYRIESAETSAVKPDYNDNTRI
jgi:hypothetical protein